MQQFVVGDQGHRPDVDTHDSGVMSAGTSVQTIL